MPRGRWWTRGTSRQPLGRQSWETRCWGSWPRLSGTSRPGPPAEATSEPSEKRASLKRTPTHFLGMGPFSCLLPQEIRKEGNGREGGVWLWTHRQKNMPHSQALSPQMEKQNKQWWPLIHTTTVAPEWASRTPALCKETTAFQRQRWSPVHLCYLKSSHEWMTCPRRKAKALSPDGRVTMYLSLQAWVNDYTLW